MTDYMQLLRNWDTILAYIGKIHDAKAKKHTHDALLLKAINEWGFNPEQVGQTVNMQPELTESDKEILEAIKAACEYKVDILKRTDISKEMLQFVRAGGRYEDIPPHIQCDSLHIAYKIAKDKIHADLMVCADNVINRTVKA